MAILFSHIKSLVNAREKNQLLRGDALSHLPCIEDAYLIVDGQEIAEYGEMKNLNYDPKSFAFHIDAKGRFILPSWCDSHTHLVFAGSREEEFVDKLKGLSYADIAAKGGGILSSAKKVNLASEDELFKEAWQRLEEVTKLGTGAIEIKSGYGLSVEGELKMLRVIKRLKEASGVLVRSTFLGAHAVPAEYKENREGYINLILNEMLPLIGKEKLADYIDVFCDQGFFTPDETRKLLEAGNQYGLKAKLHANQLSVSGGVQAGVEMDAVSVDHLENMDGEAINCLAASKTIGTLLPTAAFFLRMPYQPARKLIEAGCAIALATDFNPGSSPSGNMNFVVSLSCIQMKMLPEEAINAATLNGAFAMEIEKVAGSITRGKRANLILTKPISSLYSIPYFFGNHSIERVMLGGQWIT